MGVTVTATNSNYSFDMGSGGFFNLRKNIAYVFDKEVGEHYETLFRCWSKEERDAWDRKMNKILSDDRFRPEDEDVLDFLFASDCGGSASHKTCKKIYGFIKDINFGNRTFVYSAHSDGKDYEHFKAFLLECYKNRRKMRWS